MRSCKSASRRQRSGVAPLERLRHPGAEVQPWVPGICLERVAKAFGGRMRLAGVERGPGSALHERAARIDLGRGNRDQQDQYEWQRPKDVHADSAIMTSFLHENVSPLRR